MRLPLPITLVPLVCLLLSGFDQPPRRAPEFCRTQILNVSDDARFSMKALRGRVVLVVFYNPEDAGLERLMASLKTWYAEFQKKGLQIVAIYTPHWNYENANSHFFDMVKKFGVTFPVLEDKNGRTSAAYDELMSPAVFCVDRKGFIRAKFAGVFEMKDVRVTVEDLLQEAP